MHEKNNSNKNKTLNSTTYVNVNNATYQNNLVDPTIDVNATDDKTNSVKNAYANKLKDEGIIDSEEIMDYKINEIEIVSDEQKKIIVEMNKQNYKNDDIFAYLTYSVKPEDLDNSVLNTGTGVENGEWLTFNRICVCIRDGIIISAGTSW